MRKKNKTFASRPVNAVVVDGACEVWYVQMLKRNERNINVNLEPKIPQKKNITEQYEAVRRLLQDYDKVFWIIDYDTILLETKQAKAGTKTAQQQLNEFRQKLAKENVIIIINNPCLEFWFLLHFESTNKYFDNCDKAGKQLKNHLPDYEKSERYHTKNDNDIYLRLKPHLSTAISNAKGFNAGDLSTTSKSEMNLLFEELGIS